MFKKSHRLLWDLILLITRLYFLAVLGLQNEQHGKYRAPPDNLPSPIFPIFASHRPVVHWVQFMSRC